MGLLVTDSLITHSRACDRRYFPALRDMLPPRVRTRVMTEPKLDVAVAHRSALAQMMYSAVPGREFGTGAQVALHTPQIILSSASSCLMLAAQAFARAGWMR